MEGRGPAKWLLEHDPDARILVVTDRDELDKQIEGVMKNAGVIGPGSPSPRITSRAEFVEKLGSRSPRLLCALLHKFDAADLNGPPPPVNGRFYVFVDECHRTQGGDMNRQMKRWLTGAIFIGFTGTPLLRKDKLLTRDVFGTYIHYVISWSGFDQRVALETAADAARAALAWLRAHLAVVALAAAALAAVTRLLTVLRRRASLEPRVVTIYRALRARLGGAAAIADSMGPGAVLGRHGHEAGVREIVEPYIRERYSGIPADRKTLALMRRALRVVRRRESSPPGRRDRRTRRTRPD